MPRSIPLLIVYALAVYRLCRLAIDDEITAPLRDWVSRWAHVGQTKATPWTYADRARRAIWKLATCYYCLSIWVGAGVTILARYQGAWWSWVCAALALSSVTGYLAERS